MIEKLILSLDRCEIFYDKGENISDKVFKIGFKIKGDKNILVCIYLKENNKFQKDTYTLLSKEEYEKCKNITNLNKFLTEENYKKSLNIVKEIEKRLNHIETFKNITLDKVSFLLLENDLNHN